MGKKKSGKKGKKQGKRQPLVAEGWKTKAKCCRKNPRCKKCPVVYSRLLKAGAFDSGSTDLSAELKHARRW